MLRLPAILGAAASALALAAPASAQVMTGGTVRAPIIGAVLGDKAGEAIGRAMDAQARALKQGLSTGALVGRVGEGIVLRLESRLLFPPASDRILPAGGGTLRAIAASLKANPETQIVIVGHTDTSGDASDNMGLSYRRAEAARTFLIAEGVDAARLRIEGRGGTEPIASNEEAPGRALNQRLEMAIFAGEAHREAMQAKFGG
jgi:outer membrane protein OmpA-like peptidoglycan-associated protein